ncbi:MAG: M57 family metalloprotease [Gemmatimonadota bacterium]|jgi:hypothetical protein
MRRRALLLAVLVLAACDPPTIPGRDAREVYDFTLTTVPPLVLHWPAGRTVRVWVEPGSSDAKTAILDAAFRHAADAWNDVAVFAEFRLARTADLADADVVLTWSDVLSPVDTRDCRPAGVLAVTTFCIDGLGGNAPALRPFPLAAGGESHVQMLVTVLATQAAAPDVVKRLVTHEFGHVLGIGRHSDDPDDLMWSGDPPGDRPGPRDAATVQLLYHVHADIEA